MASSSTETTTAEKFMAAMQRVYRFPVHNPTTFQPAMPWMPPPLPDAPITPPPEAQADQAHGHHHKGRHLWTDAFGVLNFLTLHRRTGSELYLRYAELLAQTVQDALSHSGADPSKLPASLAGFPEYADPIARALSGGVLREGSEIYLGSWAYLNQDVALWLFSLNRLAVSLGMDGVAGEEGRKWNDAAIKLAKAIYPPPTLPLPSSPGETQDGDPDSVEPVSYPVVSLDPIPAFTVLSLLQEADGPSSQVLSAEIERARGEAEKDMLVIRRLFEELDQVLSMFLGLVLLSSHWVSHKNDCQWAAELVTTALHATEKVLSQPMSDHGDPDTIVALWEFTALLGFRCALLAGPGAGAGAGAGTTVVDGDRMEKMQTVGREIIERWEELGLVPNPGESGVGEASAATCVTYAAALDPGVFQRT